MYEEIGKILADAAGNWRAVEEDCRDWRRELRRLQRDRDSSDPVAWARIQKLKRRLTCLELAVYIMRVEGQDMNPADGAPVFDKLGGNFKWSEGESNSNGNPPELESEEPGENENNTLDHLFNHKFAGRRKHINARDCILPLGKDWQPRKKSRDYSAE